MNKSLRIKLAVVLIIILAFAGWFFYPGLRQRGEKTSSLKVIPEKKIDLQAQDILYTEVGSGDVKYEIRAKTLRYQREGGLAEFDNVDVKLILKNGKIYTITSDQGTYNAKQKDITMVGNVVVKSQVGERILTDKLSYKNAERVIYTTSPVVMVNKDIEVWGVGMRLLLEKKQLTLMSHVKAKISAKR
jgi:LPS export ABC transporter protein LptC